MPDKGFEVNGGGGPGAAGSSSRFRVNCGGAGAAGSSLRWIMVVLDNEHEKSCDGSGSCSG
jgi:hypothetical protein